MSLVDSNTYIEPAAATALNIGRIQYNNSMRSLLTNFYSVQAPASVNFSASGTNFAVPDGTLFRSANTSALYVADSTKVTSSPVGGTFTRIGIGNRVENGIVALGANATSYEIGELVATVSENGTLAANSRLYLVTSNTTAPNSTAGFLDVGAPLGYSIGLNDNTTFTGQQVIANRFYATANLAVGTTTPNATFQVAGTSRLVGNVTVTGSVSASGDFNTASDSRLKENVLTIDNALNKTTQLNGVYYNMIGQTDRRVGVIAQDIEKILPEVVSQDGDYKAVSYGSIIGLLIEAIKELNNEIIELKNKD